MNVTVAQIEVMRLKTLGFARNTECELYPSPFPLWTLRVHHVRTKIGPDGDWWSYDIEHRLLSKGTLKDLEAASDEMEKMYDHDRTDEIDNDILDAEAESKRVGD